VVHRDIKPANLLFGEDGRLRIADFGLARAISEASWTEPAGVMLGTARYASPEQATGQPLTGKSDVYSLALSLIESATGSVPFSSDTTVATLMARLGKLMPVSADLGPIAPVLERAGRPEPDDRYDASEFGRALLTCAERLPRPAPLPLVISQHARELDPTSISPAPGSASIVSPSKPDAVDSETAGPKVESVAVPAPSDKTEAKTDDKPAPKRSKNKSDAKSAPETPEVAKGVSVHDGLAPLPTVLAKRKLGRGPLWGLIGLVVAALAAVGVVVYNGSRTKTYPVKSLVGISASEAENEVSTFGWVLSPVKEKSDETPEPGIILRQDPDVGTKLKKGDTITITVSDGPKPSPLPDVTNLPKADAEAALAAQKLKLKEVSQANDEVVPVGSVISWTVNGLTLKPGSAVEKGTQVDVVVSSGPAPRVIPDIRGMTWENTKAAIEAAGFKVKRLEDIFSDKRDAGIVAYIDPEFGTTQPRDSEVRVAISKGPDVVVVPNIYGTSVPKAEELLKEAGLERSTLDGPLDRPVIEADPKPGTVVRRGSKVKVRTG
jgi:serine/threonine-protein kinase